MITGFKMKYQISKNYLTKPSKRRSGIALSKVMFLVAHDTGNPGSTAEGNVSYYQRSRDDMSASAHTFIDDDSIIECIPATLDKPEKAWHVIYDVDTDNKLFGEDANDAAIGVELCYGGKINNLEAYKRYVWYLAYLCFKFSLDPAKKITAHYILDPKRKSDPKSGLATFGKTFEQLLLDVQKEYKECIQKQEGK